jgi:hypothetical protein
LQEHGTLVCQSQEVKFTEWKLNKCLKIETNLKKKRTKVEIMKKVSLREIKLKVKTPVGAKQYSKKLTSLRLQKMQNAAMLLKLFVSWKKLGFILKTNPVILLNFDSWRNQLKANCFYLKLSY